MIYTRLNALNIFAAASLNLTKQRAYNEVTVPCLHIPKNQRSYQTGGYSQGLAVSLNPHWYGIKPKSTIYYISTPQPTAPMWAFEYARDGSSAPAPECKKRSKSALIQSQKNLHTMELLFHRCVDKSLI